MVEEVSGIDQRILRSEATQAKKTEQTLEVVQNAIEETLDELSEYAIFNPLKLGKDFKTIEERLAKPQDEAELEKTKDGDQVKKEASVKNSADKFATKNPELNAKALIALRSNINPDDSAESILGKIRENYPDHFLADETLDFLIETAVEGTAHKAKLQETKERFNTVFEREIKAGRNITEEARTFSKEGIGTPTGLRDLYRDITGNPREPLQLFDELMKTFDFKKMKQVLEFVLHSLGADMKSKGPSIARGELQNMFSGARTMQSILGVFRFFQQRMGMLEGQFRREDLTLPTLLKFELLSEQFMKLIAERYPSTDKILRLASLLGIADEIIAQVIIYTQYRDAMRQVSPRLFKSERHRQDLLKTILDTISELDDQLEEEEEEDEVLSKKKKRTMDTME